MNILKSRKIGAHCILACLYFLLLPTTIAVNSAGNSFLKLATIPIAAYFLITIIFSQKTLQFNAVHLLLCIYTLSTLITLFVSPDTVSIYSVMGYFLNAALYLCLTVVRYNEEELSFMENVQVLLLLILVTITLFSSGKLADRTTLMIFGQKSDPNYFVGFFVFPICVTLKKVIESRWRILFGILLSLSVYCIFLTGSRGGLLAIVATIAAFTLIYPEKAGRKALILLAGCVFLLFAWLAAVPFLPDNIISRMTIENVIETGGTGRWGIWRTMLREIKYSQSSFLLGRGFDSMNKIFMDGKWTSAVAHNQLIQVLYNQGIFGLIAFLSLTVGCFLRCMRKRSTVSIAIIGMLALSVSLSFNQTTRTFWNLVAYAALNFSRSESNRSPEVDKV